MAGMTWMVAAMAWAMVATAACAGDGDGNAGRGPAAQGIVGRVERLTGDFTPRVGPGAGGSKRSKTPLAVPVHVFRGRVKMFEKPDPRHPALFVVVRADKEGRFRVPLEPGEYTVVAEIDGRMYLNDMTDAGEWTPLQIEPGVWRDVRIEDTSEAAF
jgi:hypothetical protein